ncbi:hypothetical protein K490DRAFT_15904, partial [Saccharata proteae CBS 121410]
ANATTRLHITPFNPTLLKTYLPPSVLPSATGISYHATQTFPEKGFGYVEIPTMDAQKLKKKFNGSILKGAKVRIEDARPEKRKRVLEDQIDNGGEEKTEKSKKRLKKPKRTEKLVTGFELPDERHVKRGWTEPEVHGKAHKDAKARDKKDKKDKKRKAEPSKSKSKQGKTSRDIVIHEFEKTTKHATFLKGTQISKDAKPAAEYVEGKGWVDEDGNVVEPEPEQRQKRRDARKARKAAELRDVVQNDGAPPTDTKQIEPQDVAPQEESKEVHPLEALFKRPKAPETGSPSKLAPINTSFSFFDAEAEEDDLGELPAQTPHTFQDRQVRGIRSAAPTPDTAAIGKKFLPPWRDEDEDEEGDSRMADASNVPASANADAEKEELPQSDFAKHFWEKRGDYNRAWKKRRRDSMKQKRQRDNRKVGRRV